MGKEIIVSGSENKPYNEAKNSVIGEILKEHSVKSVEYIETEVGVMKLGLMKSPKFCDVKKVLEDKDLFNTLVMLAQIEGYQTGNSTGVRDYFENGNKNICYKDYFKDEDLDVLINAVEREGDGGYDGIHDGWEDADYWVEICYVLLYSENGLLKGKEDIDFKTFVNAFFYFKKFEDKDDRIDDLGSTFKNNKECFSQYIPYIYDIYSQIDSAREIHELLVKDNEKYKNLPCAEVFNAIRNDYDNESVYWVMEDVKEEMER